MVIRFFILTLILLTNLLAQTKDSNSSKEPSLYENLLSLDYIQSNISKKIFIFSNKLDHSLTTDTEEDDTDTSSEEESSLYSVVNIYNDFFKDETYLSTTSKSYIRLKSGAEVNGEEGFSYFNDIRVNLRLPKTEKSLYLFIGEEDAVDETKAANNTRSIGIKYVMDNLDILNISLSAGFRGISNPFTKLQFQYPIVFKHLLFRPIQYIEYSIENEFKEETLLYFDYRLDNKVDLIRLSLSRYTKARLSGMNYSAQLAYISALKHAVGFQVYTSISGQTKVQTTEPANTKYNVTPKKGINNYSTGIIWRQNLFKKYLFYELQPLVEFSQQYNYNANYIFRAHIELYFGNI